MVWFLFLYYYFHMIFVLFTNAKINTINKILLSHHLAQVIGERSEHGYYI